MRSGSILCIWRASRPACSIAPWGHTARQWLHRLQSSGVTICGILFIFFHTTDAQSFTHNMQFVQLSSLLLIFMFSLAELFFVLISLLPADKKLISKWLSYQYPSYDKTWHLWKLSWETSKCKPCYQMTGKKMPNFEALLNTFDSQKTSVADKACNHFYL